MKINANVRQFKTTKTSKTQIRDLTDVLKSLAQKIHNQYVVMSKDLFKKQQKEIIENEKEFCSQYNSYVDTLNQEFLNNNNLKWKITIKHIERYYDKTSITIYDGSAKRDFKDLNEYASDGQKRIIAIILATLHASDKYLIVLDDVISSLDTDNINIFISILKRITDDPTRNFILLTHSYTLLSKLGLMKNVDFFAFENTGNECTIFKINGLSCLFIPNLLSEKANDNNKTLFYATVIREVIENYILYPKKEYEIWVKKQLLKFKNDLEWLYRHYKTNNYTFKKASKYIKDNFSNVIELFDHFHIKHLIDNNSDVVISKYVLNFNNKLRFKNLLDYISQKYLYSLRLRFVFEREAYNKLPKEIKNEWDENKIYGIMSAKGITDLMSQEKIDIFKNMFSHNHLNNLRWTNVIEAPLYKTKIYLNIIKTH